MRDHVLLYVNGRRLEVRGPAAFVPLSTFLRQHLELTGTKVVCAEGDCGACAVLVGRRHCGAGVPPASPAAGGLDYQPITSCIAIVAQFDRAHIITVEGLRPANEPHPVQEALLACHASQCGYCTPGFVMSLCAHAEHSTSTDPTDLRAALIGNLCRCTGYESILNAGATIDRSRLKPLNDLYPPAPLIVDFTRGATQGVRIDAAGQTFFQPSTLPEALAFKTAHPECTILAGGTDLGVQVNKGTRTLATILSLAAIPELNAITMNADTLTVGANATLTDLERATKTDFPELYPMLTRHGSPLIRNSGTLAGNIVNGSPIADALPALYVLNAEVEIASTTGGTGVPPVNGFPAGTAPITRRINLNSFFTAYKRTVMTPDELITTIHIPRLKSDEFLRLYKVSKRRDLDISTFTTAVWLRRSGDTITDARLANGGVGPNILRLPRAESLLRGQPITEDLFRRAGQLARTEITPISDVRGRADYRLRLAENILLKFYHDLAPHPLVHAEEGSCPQ
jgi:xanthine dehydrogenase small subunit